MRNPDRIPIILENIDWFNFLKFLSEKFDDFSLSESENIAKEIISYGNDNIKIMWASQPDQRLVQLLFNLNFLKQVCSPGLYNYEETDYFITQKILKPEEILFWGTYGKDGKSPLRWIKLKDMESAHIEACLNTQPKMSPLYRQTMLKILRQRKLKNVDGSN